jgi:tripartite-type tricarboxylate transporter receptor subunit TctC
MRGTGDATGPTTGQLTGWRAAALACMASAQAQDWTPKTGRVINPSAPGTTTDMVARIIGVGLTSTLILMANA